LKPESAQQKEVGIKTELFGSKLRTGLAYFEVTKQNVKTTDVAHALDPACAVGCFIAVGEVQSKGTELDIQGQIKSGWRVIATYAHTDIRITKSNNGDVGLRMPNVPKHMASLWTTYEVKGRALRGWRIGGGIAWRSSATDYTNTLDTPGYALVDAMAARDFETGKNRITVQFNISNLLNKTYYSDAVLYGNVAVLEYGTPRSATVSLRFQH
jgi:iron complex outermembrane receptor protein